MPDIEDMLFKQLQGTLNPEEATELEAWKSAKPGNREFADTFLQPLRLTEQLRVFASHDQETARQEAIQHLFPQRQTYRWWAAAAAVLLLLLSAGSYFFKGHQEIQTMTINTPAQQGAILTLSNGSHLRLDTVKNGVIALQGGVTAKVVNGTLTYQGNTNGTLYNTMSTPKGRLFQLTLPDGSQVWLNSASSIRYPIAFNGPERKVEITGEAFFDIAPNAQQPFIVDINKKTVLKVLGTQFNINAYDNEPTMATTLLEGAVQVASHTLQPGQQARWQTNADIKIVPANTAKVMAWKNGLFDFDGASLEEVMRQLERWYDIEVVIEKPLPDIRFGGKMTRGITLSEMLEILKGFEGADVKFRMDGQHRLIVSH